jgi:hypothetical protein
MLDRHDALAVSVAIVASLACVLVAVVSAAMLLLPASPTPRAAPAESCLEWTDECVVCTRTGSGEACSTPGIACTRGPKRCLRR